MDPIKYFRMGFVGVSIKNPCKDYQRGEQIFVEALFCIRNRLPQYVKGFKDGCQLLHRYAGDSIYDLGYRDGRATFLQVCRDRRVGRI